jgi:ectoine hydroxylase-related dioxygenase (phytanoyl-CoA dioxygenase family)
MIDKATELAFERDGYLILDNIFPSGDLSEFANALREVIRASLRKAGLDPARYDGSEFDAGIQAIEDVNHSFVADIYDTIAQVPEFLRLIANREISRVVNRLLQRAPESPLYTFTGRCRIDLSRGVQRLTDWHQEVFYSIPRSRFLQIWTPLISDVTLEMGAIEVCKGSHAGDIAAQSFDGRQGNATPYRIDPEEVRRYESIRMPLNLGQVLVFSSRLFHRSRENTSGRCRYSLVCMYHDLSQDAFRAAQVKFTYMNGDPGAFYAESLKSDRGPDPAP